MEFQIALNTIFLLMMAVFPGFLFRKFYFVGEFTKQFKQGTQFDKLVWNIFFSSLSIIVTVLFVYLFNKATHLPLLESISYESISKLVQPIKESEIPDKKLVYAMYKDLLILVGLIYFFASFLGLTCHWVVTVFGLDIAFPVLRYNNYWYYYIHGGRILYNKKPNRKREFTAADILCEQAGSTQLYSGIISQYVINREDNNIETIFLTNVSRYKITKNEDGSTKEVLLREIPGDTLCIPYSRVININLSYVYKPIRIRDKKKLFISAINILFLIALVFVCVSMFFDLTDYNIQGFLSKTGYLFWSMMAISNIKLVLEFIIRAVIPSDKADRFEGKHMVPGQISVLLCSLIWLYYTMSNINFWLCFVISLTLVFFASLISESLKKDEPNS